MYLHLDNYSVGFPAIILTIIIVILCQSLVGRLIGAETITKCHQVASIYLQVVGTFYAVLLGLIVVDSINKFQNAQSSIDHETTAIISIYTSAEQFPKQRDHLEKLVQDYTKEVLDVELPMMGEAGRTDPRARELTLEILKTVKRIEPVTENQKAMFSMLLSETSNFLIARKERIKAANFGEPGIEWLILIVGGIVTIILTFFFTIEDRGVHSFMMGLVTLIILMSLYLIYLFSSPFSGDLKVSVEPYRNVFDFANWTADKPTEDKKYNQNIDVPIRIDDKFTSRDQKKIYNKTNK